MESLESHNFTSESKKCAAIDTSNLDGHWKLERCDQQFSFICQMKKLKESTSSKIELNQAYMCPSSDWKLWENACYLFLPNRFQSWASALLTCKRSASSAWNVTLVSIHSADENTYIQVCTKTINRFIYTKLQIYKIKWQTQLMTSERWTDRQTDTKSIPQTHIKKN